MAAHGRVDVGLYTLSCRRCEFSTTAPVFDGVRVDMTMEEAQNDVMGRMIRAQNEFFRDHWQHEHPEEAAEITRHIVAVTQLTRVRDYQTRVFDSQFEGLQDGGKNI